MKALKSLIIAVCALVLGVSFLFPEMGSAHGGGPSLTKQVGPYTIDVHYPFVLQAGVPVWLNFFLTNTEDKESAEFTDLDVSVMRDKQVMLKTNITKKRGRGTGAVFTFPSVEDYRIHLVFNDVSIPIVETFFDVEVQPARGALGANIMGIFLNKELVLGLIFGIASMVLFTKYRSAAEHFDGK